MSDVARLRRRLLAALFAPLVGASLAAGCESKIGIHTPPCSEGSFCARPDQVASVAVTSEQDLGCAKRIDWMHDGGPPMVELPPDAYADLDVPLTEQRRVAGAENACCYHWTYPCVGGRPLLEAGAAVLPEVRAGAPGTPIDRDAALDARTRAALAAAWLEDARAEHASIASFARAAIELLAVGAPLDLVAATQRASLDEVRHAEHCFALASRYARRALSPGNLPAVAPRTASLAQVARDTFVEGCVGETVAALAAERALARCEDDSVRSVLAGIAEDETAHAALAWRMVAWALGAGGSEARRAVLDAAEEIRRHSAEEDAIDDDTPAALALHGRLGPGAQQRARHEAWRGVVEPMLGELLPG